MRPSDSTSVRHYSLTLGICLIVCGCGKKPTEPATPAKPLPSPAAANEATPVLDPKFALALQGETTLPPVNVMQLETIENSIGMKLIRIPEGEFLMGSPESEKGRAAGELQRKVKIEKAFFMSAYEVTQQQYEKVMGVNPSTVKLPDVPVGNVSYKNASEFCRILSEMENQTYRLPTEQEWEYACRAGTTTVFHFGNEMSYLNACFHTDAPYGTDKKSRRGLPMVRKGGSYQPNPFGLYDMHGNVWEWCLDALPGFNSYVLRGGGLDSRGEFCRSATRWGHNSGWEYTGLRVVRTLEPSFEEIKIPLAPPLDQATPIANEDLLAQMKDALNSPALELLPPVVIFPAVDAKRKLRTDGAALSGSAAYAMTFTPQRRMEIPLCFTRHRLSAGGCFQRETEIDDATIDVVLAAVGASKYVLPQIEDQPDGGWKLTFALHTFGDSEKPETEAMLVGKEEYGLIPGKIAQSILEQLGEKLTDADVKHINTPPFATPDDGRKLHDMTAGFRFGKGDADLHAFLEKNPKAWLAWELLATEASDSKAAAERLSKSTDAQSNDGIQLYRNFADQKSQESFLRILELSPKFPKDTDYFYILGVTAKALPDKTLVEKMFDEWRKAEPTYGGSLTRGDLLVDWAWDARGGGWARDVTREGWKDFGARLEVALAEYNEALRINPKGWEAHAALLTIGKALGLPRDDFMKKHFQAAIRLRPRDSQAYERMFESLMFRWGGTRDELLEFSKLCIETNYWLDGIPDIGRRAFEEVTHVDGVAAIQRTAFGDPEVWELVKLYKNNAAKHANEEWSKYALNIFAKYGAYGGKLEEVADAFQQIDQQKPDERVFWDSHTYGFLRDIVFSEFETGQAKVRASVRRALDAGDLDRAEEMLKQLDPQAGEDKPFAERCRKCIEFGRRLKKEKKLQLTSKDAYALFEGIDGKWSIEGDRLVCKLPANTNHLLLLPFGLGPVEIEGQIHWVEQAPAYVVVHAHTRAMRAPVSLLYDYLKFDVTLMRGRSHEESGPVGRNRIHFRVQRTADRDYFRAAANLDWSIDVIEPVPSGFGLQFWSPREKEVELYLQDISLKLP